MKSQRELHELVEGELLEFKRKSLELALAVRKHEKERMIVDKKYAWVLARELLEIEESLNE